MANVNADRQHEPVVRVEDLANDLADILEFSRLRAAKIRQAPSVVSTTSADESNDREELTARLRAVLEDEIVPAKETHDGRIATHEVNREIIKKALVGLKTDALKKLSREAHLPVSLPVEKLAENIAKHYAWDESEVARLILENDTDVRPERGHSTRFFPLTEPPDMERVRERLGYVTGRYIRTGLAKWFVFDDITEAGEGFELAGSLRTYEASIDGRLEGAPRLSAAAAPELPARIEIQNSDLLLVYGATLTVAREAVRAADTAADIDPLWRIPFIDPSAPAVKGELHGASLFMLDLLVNRFRTGGLGEVNMTVARFRTKESDALPWDAEVERQASLKVVQFEGDFLLGSRPACQLLATEQRPLGDMTIQVTTRGNDRIITGRFPARITLERDHVSVSTSFGNGKQELSLQVHSIIVQAVQDEITNGFGNESRLKEFVKRVFARAQSAETDGAPDLLDEDRV